MTATTTKTCFPTKLTVKTPTQTTVGYLYRDGRPLSDDVAMGVVTEMGLAAGAATADLVVNVRCGLIVAGHEQEHLQLRPRVLTTAGDITALLPRHTVKVPLDGTAVKYLAIYTGERGTSSRLELDADQSLTTLPLLHQKAVFARLCGEHVRVSKPFIAAMEASLDGARKADTVAALKQFSVRPS
jgi:hypothetical protein